MTTESKSIFTIMVDFMKSIIADRDGKISELESKLEVEKVRNEEMFTDIERKLNLSNAKNDDLCKQIAKLNDAHDELEAYGRRDSLIFSGEKIQQYQPGEDCVAISKNIIKSLKISCDPIISTAHRMGMPPAAGSNAPDKRAIIVKFCQRDDKFRVMKQATNKSTRIPGLFASESLTRTRAKIFSVLRQCKKLSSGLVTGVFTNNGRVFVLHKPSSTASDDADSLKKEINTMEMLKDFCTNFLKLELEEIVDTQGRQIFQ